MSHETKSDRVEELSLAAGVLTLLCFAVVAWLPDTRLWGLAAWTYRPWWVPVGLLAIGVIAIFRVRRAMATARDGTDNRRYYLLSAEIALTFGILLYLLRSRAHFLGDGYQILANLAAESPFVKPTDLGEMLIHLWLKPLFGDGEAGALMIYQAISFASGLLFFGIAVIASARVFQHNLKRLLFVLGLISGGYSLLFFGYVEHYSMFAVSVLAFVLFGLMIGRGQMTRWWILAPLAVAIFLHGLGIVLVPAAAVALISRTAFGRNSARFVRTYLWVVVATGLIMAAALYLALYNFGYQTRFLLVPVLSDMFTVEGYTLFSADHLADILNLLIILVPGLLVFLVWLVVKHPGDRQRNGGLAFLLTVIVSALGVVFVLDPRLGMPRDWDLLSFAGIPLTVLVHYLFLRREGIHHSRLVLSGTVITLSLLSLIPRAIQQASPETAAAQFIDYIKLDTTRNRNASKFLPRYYESVGDMATAESVDEWRRSLYPQTALNDSAMSRTAVGEYRQAAGLLWQAVTIDPTYWDAWTNLGQNYWYLKKADSALILFDIAAGWNPYNASIAQNAAAVNFNIGNLDEAERLSLKALNLEPERLESLVALAVLSRRVSRTQDYFDYPVRIAAHPEVPMVYLRELGDQYLAKGRFDEAADVYRRALTGGLDTAIVCDRLEKYPALRRSLDMQPATVTR